jgi:hypothetical protein
MSNKSNYNDYRNNFSLPEYRIKSKRMEIKVTREIFTPTCTLGKMYVDGVFFAHTLEDTFRNIQGDITKKVSGQTCIDNGTYPVIVSYSNRFKKNLAELLNVPCFEKIRIHGGNTDADTEGCILIGEHTDNIGKIWECGAKVQEITERIYRAGGCMITIESMNQPV